MRHDQEVSDGHGVARHHGLVRHRSAPARPDIVELPPIRSICLVTSEPHLGVVVFVLQGQLDSSTAIDAGRSLTAALGHAAVILDLSGVTLADAEGVAVLREVIRGVHEQGGSVAIARPWRTARPILGLIGMEGFVFLAVSAAGAISWLSDLSHRPAIHDESGIDSVHTAAG